MKAKLRILNLEDNQNDAELNEAMISARWPECEFVRVDTREEFIKALKDGNYDIILSDYTMPSFDGLSALALAQENTPHIPFLFVSGTIGEDTAIEALKRGATDYVLKHHPVRLIPATERALRDARDRVTQETAEEAMRQSEYKYRVLFECLSDAAFLSDIKTGKIIDVNHRAQEMLGHPREKILGCKRTEFLKMIEDGRHELIRADASKVQVQVRETELTLYDRPLILHLCHEAGGR